VNASRTLAANHRVVVVALAEIESAGFKEHAKVALDARRSLNAGFELHAHVGVRFSDTNYAPLVPWIEDSDPAYGAGVRYKELVDLTWTTNYFGTGDNHWHLTVRARFGADKQRRD
jgi:hypothetical protein